MHERVACNPIAVVQRASVLLQDYKSSCPVQPKVFASEIGFYDVVLEGPPVVFLLDLHVEVLGPSIESM